MVYIDDVHTRVFEKSLCKFVIHWYDNLLTWRIFCSHVDLGFGFAVITIYDLLNYIDLLVGKIWEDFSYFQYINCDTWWWDWFDWFRLRGYLCIRLLLRGFVAFLEVLWDFINFFLQLCWNRWGKWEYEDRFSCFLSFVVNLRPGDLRIEFWLDFVSESCFVVIYE